MRLDLRSDSLSCGLQADATVEVMRDDSHDKQDDAGCEQPIHYRCVERKLEDVKSDIGLERLIVYAEASAIAEKDPLVPVARHSQSGKKRKNKRNDHANGLRSSTNRFVIALKQVVFWSGRANLRTDAVSNHQVDEHHHKKRCSENCTKSDLRSEHAGENRTEAQRVEPHPVGPEAGEAT